MELTRHWKEEDINFLCNRSYFMKKRTKSLVPDWKFLIRK